MAIDSTSPVATGRAALADLLSRMPGRGVERVCSLVAGLLVLSGLFHLGVFALGGRPWDGPLSWRKPATFGLSFGTTLATVTWVTSHVRMSSRMRATLLGIFAADCVLEVAGITVQAWRDVPSHFNTETPFDATVAFSLGFGGAVLIAVLGAFAVTAFRGRIDGPPSLRLALRAGFAFLVAGLVAGVAMIVRGSTLANTGHRAEAYDRAGFLKLFHAVTLHAILVLPAIAWWLARRDIGDETRRTRIVVAVTSAYVLAALGVLVWSVARV